MKTDLQIILGFSLSLISHSQSAAKPRQSCCTTLSLIPIPTLLSMAAVSLIRFLACLPALVSHLSSSVASSTLQTGLSSSMPGTKQWLKSMFADPESLIFFQHLIQNSKGVLLPLHVTPELFGLPLDALPSLTWLSVTAPLLELPSGQAEGPPLVLSCTFSFVHPAFSNCNTLPPKYILPTLQEATPMPPAP